MEENSSIHMETDVSSTTDDAIETQEVTGSNGQLEMTITVEKVNEEEPTSNMETDSHMHSSNNVSSISTVQKVSPSKEQQNIAKISPSKTESSKPLQKSPTKTEFHQKVTIISPAKVTMTSPDLKADKADSSTKSVSLISPTKVKIQCNQPKLSDLEKIQVTQSSPPKQPAHKKTILIIKKSPIKDSSIVKSPVKVNEPQLYSQLVELTDPVKPVEKCTTVDTSDKRYYQVIQRSPPGIKSPPIKLVRRPPSKDFKVQDTNVKEDASKTVKIPAIALNKESSDEKSLKVLESTQPSTSKEVTVSTENMNGETDSTSIKPNLKEAEPEKPTAVSTDIPMDVLEAEASNDSQLSSTTSEKEHNKSISRELKSLINSAKESKIISECTQLTSKTRKSRTNLDLSHNTTVESDNIQDSQTDDKTLKRSMRSQNPDFVIKCKQFLNSVTSKAGDEPQSDGETDDLKRKQKADVRIQQADSAESTPKKKKLEEPVPPGSNKLRSDPYCWRCHWPLEAEPNEKQPIHPPLHCTVCVRSYHAKCMTVVERKMFSEKNWACPDCLQILQAESSDSRSQSMKKISLGMLCDLLKYALERMEALNGVEPFLQPVDRTAFPDYDKVVVHPMDLSQMRQNITDGQYGSTEAFIADAQWILHNSILFNACEQNFPHSKLTQAARALVRTCRAEMIEIETCPECYAGAHSRNLTYFTDVCSTPHMILWAKLKGFPYWPAKAVAVNNGMVDVRFFGQHDKSWVPVRDCYLYSEKDPNTTKHKKQELMQCRQEAELHIRNICRKYGSFVYAPFKTTFDHTKMTEQLKMMIPSFDGELQTVTNKQASPLEKDSRSSTSKSSKSSCNDEDFSRDISECEEISSMSPKAEKSSTNTTTKEQTPDESEKLPKDSSEDVTPVAPLTAKEEPKDIPKTRAQPVKEATVAVEKNAMDVDEAKPPEPEKLTRKRRRSTFPDFVTLESTAQKKKKVEDKIDAKSTPVTSKADKKPTTGPSKEKEANKSTPNTRKVEKNEPTTADTKPEAEVEELTKISENNKENPNTNTDSADKDPLRSTERSLKEKEGLRVTPIKLVALPRVNKQTPKLFTTAKVTKPTPNTPNTPTTPKTPTEEDTPLNTSTPSSSKRSKVSKADKFIITNSGDQEMKTRSSRRNSRSNKSLTSTPKEKDKSLDRVAQLRERCTDKKRDKSIDKSIDKQIESANEASTSKDKSKKKDVDRSLLKRVEIPKTIKDEKGPKKSEDDLSLAMIARENRNSNTGLPTISNVMSLSTTAEKTNPTTTKTTTNAKTTNANSKQTPATSKASKTEVIIDANSDSSIFTPTSSGNVGNMKEAMSKLHKIRGETPSESLVGRVGVKAFARMTSPDVNDEVEVKAEPIDLDEIDEERQMEKMDLMNACKLQPVSQTQSLRDVRINKVIVTPVVVKKPGGKANESSPNTRPKAKKTFPQPRRPDVGSELNGKNSMVYIPIQPPNTMQPKKGAATNAGPRPSAPSVSSSIVNTVTTPLRSTTSTLSTPPLVGTPANSSPLSVTQVSNISASNITQLPSLGQTTISQVPTVGPTTVHTVPLMTSVNGQWMFSLQPVMSVGGVDNASPHMVNGIPERIGSVPTSSVNTTMPLITPAVNRTLTNTASPSSTDTATPEMPRLMQRPLMNPFDANTPIGSLPPPSTAGPLTAKLNQNAVKLTDFFRTLLEDSIEKMDEPLAQVTALKVQLEQARWRNQQALDELKHNHELTLSEMRQSFEKEKLRIISETRRAAQVELEAAVKLTKSKQWCSNCFQEAQFYCCWNTSYCDYSCQRAHWNTHFSNCTQEQSFAANSSDKDTPESRLQQNDNPPKSAPAQTPSLTTIGGKPAPMRVFTDSSGTQKTSIIVSMVEDPSGNQTLKCVGTYKAPAPASAAKSPLLINKQTSDDSAKKTVTSGGYIIVGASGNTTSVISPPSAARRPQIQYYS